MCHNCGIPVWQPCNCHRPSSCCPPPDPSGCPVQLDFGCVIYHKNNNELSELDGLDLQNGATLELVIETIDEKIKQLNVPSWSLTYLRGAPNNYTINTLQQFGEAVDDEFADLQNQITTLAGSAAVPLIANDSATIDFSQSGTLGHTVTASVKVSGNAGNRLSAVADGLLATPQTLAADYINKKISISGGNEIDMLNFCGCDDCFGYLGELTADPDVADRQNGQYWFRTDLPAANGLRIQLNGLIRTIPTT